VIPSPPPAIISQSFADRAARLRDRIAVDGQQSALAPGQEPLLSAQLDAAIRANDAHDSNADAMLDVIDRQLAAVDFGLSRAEDGTAIVVHVGDTVTVAMRDPYLWSVQVSDTSALALHRGVMWARGVQGAFAAQKPGTVTMTLTSQTPGVTPPPSTVKQPVVFTVVILPKP
jgi:hypothetical protein